MDIVDAMTRRDLEAAASERLTSVTPDPWRICAVYAHSHLLEDQGGSTSPRGAVEHVRKAEGLLSDLEDGQRDAACARPIAVPIVKCRSCDRGTPRIIIDTVREQPGESGWPQR